MLLSTKEGKDSMPGAIANWQLKYGHSESGSSSADHEGHSHSLHETRHLSSFALFNEPWSSVDLGSSQFATLFDDDKGKQLHVTAGSYFGGQQQQDKMNSTSLASWRTAGSEELAALVAQKSVERVTNCDLPPPTSTSESHAVPISQAVKSMDANEYLSGSPGGWLGGDLLGEALCRSQSRAREAEKVAVRAFQENDKLMRLFFQEASVSFAYRQWLVSLQAENLCLRMCCRQNAAIALTTSNRPKRRNRQRRIKQQQTDADVMMRCTIAFALGLSLAGAGLLLGWGLGWIFLAT